MKMDKIFYMVFNSSSHEDSKFIFILISMIPFSDCVFLLKGAINFKEVDLYIMYGGNSAQGFISYGYSNRKG